MKLVISIVFLLVFGLVSFGQKNGKAILVDEFGSIPCDDFLARIDNFFIHLNANPSLEGYFVIRGTKESLEQKLDLELLFESATKTRTHDKSRVSIIRGDESGPVRISLWIVPDKSDTPNFEETKWDLRIARKDSPFLLRSDMAQICDPPPIDRVARDLLISNPEGSIIVIVHGPTVVRRRRELRNAKKMLAKFDPSRVRYLLRHSATPYSDYYFAVGRPKRTDFKSYF